MSISKENIKKPDAVIIGTGSELQLALDTAAALEKDGRQVRVVSMPSLDLFQEQETEYQKSIVPDSDTPVVVIEAGIRQGWSEITRAPLLFIGMEQFGVSAPSSVLAEKFGFNAEAAYRKTAEFLKSL